MNDKVEVPIVLLEEAIRLLKGNGVMACVDELEELLPKPPTNEELIAMVTDSDIGIYTPDKASIAWKAWEEIKKRLRESEVKS